MISEPKDTLICFIDGSCSDQTKKIRTAGYSVVWPFHNEYDESAKLQGYIITNNRAEFTAFLRALQIADDIDPHRIMKAHVYTDSMLLINSVTKWLPGWKRNSWIKADKKPVQNVDLLRTIDDLVNKRNVSFTHVKAHTGNNDWFSIWNDIADERAKSSHFSPTTPLQPVNTHTTTNTTKINKMSKSILSYFVKKHPLQSML